MSLSKIEKKVLQHLPAVAIAYELLEKIYAEPGLTAEQRASLAAAAFDALKELATAPPVTRAVAMQHFASVRIPELAPVEVVEVAEPPAIAPPIEPPGKAES